MLQLRGKEGGEVALKSQFPQPITTGGGGVRYSPSNWRCPLATEEGTGPFHSPTSFCHFCSKVQGAEKWPCTFFHSQVATEKSAAPFHCPTTLCHLCSEAQKKVQGPFAPHHSWVPGMGDKGDEDGGRLGEPGGWHVDPVKI